MTCSPATAAALCWLLATATAPVSRGPVAQGGTAGEAHSAHAAPGLVSSGAYTLVTEPADGPAPIYRLVTSARHTLDMTMYELSDPVAEKDLAADASRGVRVRVVLDQNLARAKNLAAFDYLKAHGVRVRWAPTSYDVTHQKTVTVDDRVSAIMTLNLTSEYYSTSRDFAIIDRDAADVAAIESVFDHDFSGARSSPEPTGSDLIWSPGADGRLVGIISSAKHELLVEDEEMREYTIVDALEAAARRGVDVELVMTYQSSWAENFNELAAAGVHVRTFSPNARLYVHAKVIAVDPGHADEQLDVGSQNFSWASLQYNRELGCDLRRTQSPVIASVASTVRHDFLAGTPWPG